MIFAAVCRALTYRDGAVAPVARPSTFTASRKDGRVRETSYGLLDTHCDSSQREHSVAPHCVALTLICAYSTAGSARLSLRDAGGFCASLQLSVAEGRKALAPARHCSLLP